MNTKKYQKLHRNYQKMKQQGDVKNLSEFCKKKNLKYQTVQKAFNKLKKDGLIKNSIASESTKCGLKLNLKQLLFCQRYTQLFNATLAYMEVYKSEYSTAQVNSSKLMKNGAVKKYLNNLKCEVVSKTQLDLKKIIEEYRKIAMYDHTKFGLGNNEFNKKDSVFSKNTQQFVKEVVSKVIVVKDSNGEEQLVRVKEYKYGHTYSVGQKLIALKELMKINALQSNDNSMYSTDYFVQDLWSRFLDRERKDKISALEFVNELTARNYEVPEGLMLQAKREIEVMIPNQEEDDENDLGISDVQYAKMEENWQKFKEHYDDQLETFVPQRKKGVHELYKKHGYDQAEKPVDCHFKGKNTGENDKISADVS